MPPSPIACPLQLHPTARCFSVLPIRAAQRGPHCHSLCLRTPRALSGEYSREPTWPMEVTTFHRLYHLWYHPWSGPAWDLLLPELAQLRACLSSAAQMVPSSRRVLPTCARCVELNPPYSSLPLVPIWDEAKSLLPSSAPRGAASHGCP